MTVDAYLAATGRPHRADGASAARWELEQLRTALKGRPRSSLQPLLVDTMLHDTAKHIAILELIRNQLRGH